MDSYLFKSNGQYLGFITDQGYIFSHNGVYLGWLESNYAWDTDGNFRGQLMEIDGHKYILKNIYTIPPIPKPQKPTPQPPVIPNPQPIIKAVELQIGLKDAF